MVLVFPASPEITTTVTPPDRGVVGFDGDVKRGVGKFAIQRTVDDLAPLANRKPGEPARHGAPTIRFAVTFEARGRSSPTFGAADVHWNSANPDADRGQPPRACRQVAGAREKPPQMNRSPRDEELSASREIRRGARTFEPDRGRRLLQRSRRRRIGPNLSRAAQEIGTLATDHGIASRQSAWR